MEIHNKAPKAKGSTLSGGYVFNDLLSTNEREYLVKHGKVRSLTEGEKLCQQNALEESVYVVLTGEVAIFEEIEESVIELGKLHKGDLVGEIGGLFSVPRIASAKATKSSLVLEVSGSSFTELLNKTPILQNAVYQRLYERSLKTALQSMPEMSSVSNVEGPDLSLMLQCWNSSNKIN